MRRLLPLLGLTVLLGACGGGGGGSSSGSIVGSGWSAGVFQPASTYAAQCAAPRTGTNPATGAAWPDKAGSVLTENNWLRSWSNDLYLWYGEIVDRDPGNYSTTAAYFDVLKTPQLTASGADKDRFHFTYPTDQWIALSQSNQSSGYGAQWSFIAVRPPRKLVVAYVEPNSPAAAAGLARGAEVLFVDGVDLVNAGDQASVDTLNAGISPAGVGESHQFTVQDPGAPANRTVTLVSQNITGASVMNVKSLSTATGNVGYLQFNDHLAGAEQGLVDAITTLKAANVTDLVIDMRYNGGGYLDIASELAYMIAGDAATAGKTFEKPTFNDKYPNTNPVTGATLQPEGFLAATQGFGALPANQALPTLNLPRVFVLTGPDTCSASEAVINGLRGADVEVIQIGETTCGKPYGFYPQDNCGTTYFSIEFKGENAKGFGDYPDGFTPAAGATSAGAQVPGCTVADDFTHALGDEAEARLAAALGWRSTTSCPAVVLGKAKGGVDLAAAHGRLVRSPLLENRILRH
ncbi:MAG: S41 family peptidase [Steroidobacteraceae bacterium]